MTVRLASCDFNVLTMNTERSTSSVALVSSVDTSSENTVPVNTIISEKENGKFYT